MDSERISIRDLKTMINAIDSWNWRHNMGVTPYDDICELMGVDNHVSRRIIDKKKHMQAKLKYGF